ncbi:hypothetical protein QBC39DRAFT_243281, partial [Podospora conica]
LAQHGTKIHSRWRKKNAHKQRAVLLSAYPKMPLAYRQTTDLLVTKLKPIHQQPAFRDACLLPALNPESLQADQNRVLSLLDARSWHVPSRFAATDLKSIEFGRRVGVIKPRRTTADVSDYTMVLNGA